MSRFSAVVFMGASLLPEVSGRLEHIGGEARASTPEEMRARVAAELQRWSWVMREAGISPQ